MYCIVCKKDVRTKRKIGIGTLVLILITFGFRLLIIPLYRKRCTICGFPIGYISFFKWLLGLLGIVILFVASMIVLGEIVKYQDEGEFNANRQKIIEQVTIDFNHKRWNDVLDQTEKYSHVKDIELQALRIKARNAISSADSSKKIDKDQEITDSKESIPLSVPSDSKATYLVLSVEKASSKNEVYITTKRTGSSDVSFAKRLVNCQNQTFMYVGDADTLEELQMQNLKGKMGHLVSGSISWYVSQYACTQTLSASGYVANHNRC